MRACRIARAQIAAALDAQLGIEDRFRLEQHLEQCQACREHERRAQKVEEWLEGPGDRPPVVPDVDVAWTRVLEALDRRPEREAWRLPSSRPRRLAWIAAVGVAATVLALIALRLVADRAAKREADVSPTSGVVLAPTTSAPIGTPEADPTSPSPDLEREDSDDWTSSRVERTTRAALLEAFSDARGRTLADGYGSGALELFQSRVREAARAGWALRPLIEGLLEHRDVRLARAAARCLGAQADPGSVAALERALDRVEVADEGLDALASIGDAAVPALERALEQPDRALRALARLCRVGGPRAALAIERRAQRSGPGSDPSRASLLDALTSTGPAAVAGLLRLAATAGVDERDEVLTRLLLVQGAGDELVRLVEAQRVDPAVVHPALAILRPVAAIPWLEARCGEHRERAAALASLVQLEGTEPLESVQRLSTSGRLTRVETLELLRGLLERDDARALTETERLVEAGDALALYDWNLLLIESEHPGAAASLATLAFCDALGPDDRQWAALAVGELGGERDARLLADLLRDRETEDRRRTAACLISIHARQGVEGVTRALPGASRSDLRAVLEALDEGPLPGAIRIHRVVRALDGVFLTLSNDRRPKKEI